MKTKTINQRSVMKSTAMVASLTAMGCVRHPSRSGAPRASSGCDAPSVAEFIQRVLHAQRGRVTIGLPRASAAVISFG